MATVLGMHLVWLPRSFCQAFLMAGLTSAMVSPHVVIHGSFVSRGCGLCLSVPWTSRNFTLLWLEFSIMDLSTLRWSVDMIMTKWSCIIGHAQ
jgi:hypothetical protein